MSWATIEQALQGAVARHQAGQLAEAEGIYRQVLAVKPAHPDALHLLGLIAYQTGQHHTAISLIEKAIAQVPDNPMYHSNLGEAYRAAGQFEQAIAACRSAIRIQPNLAHAHGVFANTLAQQGQFQQAADEYRASLALNPTDAHTHYNLANALAEIGELDPAIAAYRDAVRIDSKLAEAHFNLAGTLNKRGQFTQAIEEYRAAIALCPNAAEFHNNLASVLMSQQHLEEAIDSYRAALQIKPDYVEARSNLGVALKEAGHIDEAVAAQRRAIELNPNFAAAHGNLGNALRERGELDHAIAAYRDAIRLNQDFAVAHSNLIFTMHYHPAFDAQAIAAGAHHWNQQHAQPLARLIRPHDNDRSPDRRLKIGYVSPDFCDHCQSLFTTPLLQAHDREQFEIHCFADVARPDCFTSQLQGCVDAWHNTVGRSDQQVADLVREHRIDILMDLTMHMAGNRLLVFARQPAPVQACWLAYPGTTGLAAMQYRLTDPHLDPLGADESIYSEQTMRLPETFWCYDPLEGRELGVNPLPATQNGFVTFGCLNNFCKFNEEVFRLWARVLLRVPRSRLMLLAVEGEHRARTKAFFDRQGIDPQRVEFFSRCPRRDYLSLYHQIDLGLDSFPYNGHTTSLDCYWMGVPVVTLTGKTIVGRAGLSQLSNLGLTELLAHTPQQYEEIAVELANDRPRLTKLRATLRDRMLASPLMDAPRFARNIESAYRRMWQAWCETR